MAGDGLDALRGKRASNARKKPGTSSQSSSASGQNSGGTSGTQQDRVRRQPPRPLHRKAEPAPSPAPAPQLAPAAEEKPAPAPAPEPARPAAPPAPGPAPADQPPPAAPSGRAAEAPPAPRRPEPEPAAAPSPAPAPQPAPAAEEKPAPAPAPEPARPATDPAVGAELARHLASAAPAPATEGAPQWDQYVPPPVPEGFPRAENVLMQRFIDREPLNASVPEPLQIAHRLQLLKVLSRINHIPQGDLVTVALDWWLRGGKPTTSDIDPPWNSYTGPGTRGDIPHAEDVLQQRFINREPLKASVPKSLELTHRLTTYKVLNRLHKVPVGDVVAVAMDRWLRIMGF